MTVAGTIPSVTLGSSKGTPERKRFELRALTEVVEETLEECTLLLAQTGRTAAAGRGQACGDADRTRREATAQAAQPIDGALGIAGHLPDDGEARSVELEQQIDTLRRATRAAAAYLDSTTQEAVGWARRCPYGSESEAVALLEATLKASTALQQQLLDEPKRSRVGVDHHADQLSTAALAATPGGAASVLAAAPRCRLPRVAARRLVTAATVVVIAVALRTFIGAPYTVASTSMTPTLADGEVVMVNKVPYHLHSPRRGDMVVIRASQRAGGHVIVKRILGLPGERIESIGGLVRVDGKVLDESYLDEGASTAPFGPVDVPEGEVFVVGDNRSLSLDSRSFGPVPVGEVVGRVDAVAWPVSGLRSL